MKICINNFKRISFILCACVIFITPFFSWGSGTTKEVKADNVTSYFNGSNIFFNSMAFTANGFNPQNGREFRFNYERKIGLPSTSSQYVDISSDPYYYQMVTRYNPNYVYGSSNVPLSFQLDIGRSLRSDYENVSDPYRYYLSISNFTLLSSENKPEDFTLSALMSSSDAYYKKNSSGGVTIFSDLGNPGFNISSSDGDSDSDPSDGRLTANGLSFSFRGLDFSAHPWWIGFYNSTHIDSGFLMDSAYSIPIYCLMRLKMSSPNFTCNVNRIEMGSYYINTVEDINNLEWFYTLIQTYQSNYVLSFVSLPYNYVRYYDENDAYFEYAVPVNMGGAYAQKYPDSLLFQPRSYFLTSSFDGYDLGFKAGQDLANKNKDFEIKNAVKEAQKEWESNLNDSISDRLDAEFEKGRQYGFQQGADAEFGFGMFISSVLSVFDIPIFGNFSLGMLFMVVFGATMLMFVLKIFAGG